MKVYLDYAASTPTKPEVQKAIQPYFDEIFGNPSSVHSFGQEARKAVDDAREKVAHFLNCQPGEVIFTSGATESDNLAIKGIVKSQKAKGKKQKLHIITSQIEHHAVLHTCENLEKQGGAEVTYLPVDQSGRVSVEAVQKAIKPNTILVSIMYANNETGIIQPIREIGKMIEKFNRSLNTDHRSPILFHTDAVQAVNYLNCDTKFLHVDLLSLSGHKIGAPKGIGALYIKKGTSIMPQILGGAHEYGLRAGTENVTGIVGLSTAISQINKSKNQKIKKLRDCLEQSILKTIPDTKINGDPKNRLPNITNITFAGVEGESILLSLDMEGIAVSTGSACTSGSLEPSHVIMAMYHDAERAHGSIRFSLGWKTTQQEIDYLIKKLSPIIKRLRKFSPTYQRDKNVK